jgi:hypothetical protein
MVAWQKVTWSVELGDLGVLAWMPLLLQNTFVVSAGKVSLVSALQVDTIYTIRKRGFFSIGCCQPILKIIISIGYFKTADTNKCPAGRYLRHYWYRLS